MNSPLVWNDEREYDLSSLYALNRVVREFRIAVAREIPEASNLLIVPYLYNATTRTFQQMGFADQRWPQPRGGNWNLSEVLNLLPRNEDWTSERHLEEIISFLRYVGGHSTFSKPRDQIARLEAIRRSAVPGKIESELQQSIGLNLGQWAHLYAHYKFPRDMYLNGIFWKLRKQNPDIDSVLLQRKQMCEGAFGQSPEDAPENPSEIWVSTIKRQDGWDYRAEEHSQVTTSQTPRGAKLAFALSEFFLFGTNASQGRRRPHTNAVGLVPIYSTWLSGRGYGGIIAVLQVQLDTIEIDAKASTEEKQIALARVLTKLTEMAEILAIDLCSAAVQRATTEPIGMRAGLGEVFINTVQYLQDWERIELISFGSSGKRQYKRYHYTHDMCDGCLDIELDEAQKLENGASRGWDSSLLRTDLARTRRHVSGTEEQQPLLECDELLAACPIQLVWRDAADAEADARGAEDDSVVSVSLSDDVFSGINTGTLRRPQAAAFTFPEYFRLPRRTLDGGIPNPLWRAYCNAVVRQQKELLAALAPRLVARQQAVRTAVSAIMGRNMSHNIGSHVLARYSIDIVRDLAEPTDHRPDHRGDLLGYLQRRMDFLAEVATSDAAFWAQPLSLKEQVHRLNYQAQRKRFVGPETLKGCARKPTGECKAPVLLSYITGKESLAANVEFGKPAKVCSDDTCQSRLGFEPHVQEDVLFSCPGGEVGAHALFVIFENIIRNSARHNVDEGSEKGKFGDLKSCGAVSLFVAIDEAQSTADLIKVDIIDPRTLLNKDGVSIKRPDRGNLPRWINNKLNTEPILLESGRTNPQYWGIREMQICAHYLRGFPLSELETSEYGNEPLIRAGLHEGLPGRSDLCLKYEIYLMRPKLLAAVFDKTCLPSDPTGDLRVGILVLRREDAESWDSIARKVQRFSFLAVASDDVRWLPDIKSDQAIKALLPVRRINMDRTKLEGLVGDARQSQGNTSWMESLHREYGSLCKSNHESWKEAQDVWGVGIVDSQDWPSHEDVTRQPADEPEAGSIRWVKKSDDREVPAPLPPSWEDVPMRLISSAQPNVLGAAWIFHLRPDDIDPDPNKNFAGFADAYRKSADSKNWICVEGAYSDSAHIEYLRSAFRGGCNQELLATTYPRVAIIDERVQSAGSHTIRMCRLENLWPLMGVWVPRKDLCDLDQPNMENCKQFLRNPIVDERKTQIRPDQAPIDFLVVHLTVLERLRARDASLDDTIREMRDGIWAASAAVEVVVVTGRGVPSASVATGADQLTTARYLPVSALLESLVIRPSKLALMRVLWSARRPYVEEARGGAV